MRPVEPALLPTRVDRGPHESDILALLQALRKHLIQVAQRLNGTLPKDGSEAMTGPLRLATYLTASRPAAASYPGAIIYVSDAGAGSKFQGSDGSVWVYLG